jgi:hypothetical protein
VLGFKPEPESDPEILSSKDIQSTCIHVVNVIISRLAGTGSNQKADGLTHIPKNCPGRYIGLLFVIRVLLAPCNLFLFATKDSIFLLSKL